MYIINEICEKCYGNSDIGAVARNLNISDIEKVLKKSEWSPKEYEKNGVDYLSRKVYRNNVCYPSIYGEEEFSIIDNIEIKQNSGLNKNKQEVLLKAGSEYEKAKYTLNARQTAWENYELSENSFIDKSYYYLIFKDGYNKIETLDSYFLASRSVDLGEDFAKFGLFEVSLGNSIKTKSLFNSNGSRREILG